MDTTKYLIVGAGISGLAFANFIDSDEYIILERDHEIGGYCKTVKQDGFVWDYSGHFFHFRHPDIERYLVERMPADEVKTIHKSSKIFYKHSMVDFPFQKNIHQLPQDEFVECLYDLFFRHERTGASAGSAAPKTPAPSSFKQMVYDRFGAGIAEKFLVPYNEKLYACDLEELDANAMGRFFPHANLEEIIRNFRQPDNHSYNATFTYPRGGAIEYVKALASEVADGSLCLNEALVAIDLKRKVATTNRREIQFEYIISSAPFDRLLQLSNLPFDASAFRYNKVQVFNLGFDRKGWPDLHWVYFPERQYAFYRVGFYDNIFDTDRMSLYIEIGMPSQAPEEPERWLQRTLEDLAAVGIVDGHQLVSQHSVMLNPAYVHITQQSNQFVEQYREILKARGIYSIGRYGAWTYCAIEDNIVEARTLAQTFNLLAL